MRGWQSAKIHTARRRQSQIITSSTVQGLDKKDNNNNKRHTPTYLQDSPESNHALRIFAAEYLKFLMESVRGDCRIPQVDKSRCGSVATIQHSRWSAQSWQVVPFLFFETRLLPEPSGKSILGQTRDWKEIGIWCLDWEKEYKPGRESARVSLGGVAWLSLRIPCPTPFHL